jgi:hypothetical protein
MQGMVRPAVLAILLATPAMADPPTQIVGRVTDKASHRPDEGATVKAGAYSATTDTQGLYHNNVPAGSYAIDIAYGVVHTWSSVKLEAGTTSTVDATLDLGVGEVIEVEGRLVRPTGPKPVKDPRILPRYSDAAFLSNTWARAWLLLDIDKTGKVTRVKWLKRPGHDLEQIAIETAFATRFTPARDSHDRPTRSKLVHLIEWPSYRWVQMKEGVVTHRPRLIGQPPFDPALLVPCEGSGPWAMGSITHGSVYRDCTPPPDSSKSDKDPWIAAP